MPNYKLLNYEHTYNNDNIGSKVKQKILCNNVPYSIYFCSTYEYKYRKFYIVTLNKNNEEILSTDNDILPLNTILKYGNYNKMRFYTVPLEYGNCYFINQDFFKHEDQNIIDNLLFILYDMFTKIIIPKSIQAYGIS